MSETHKKQNRGCGASALSRTDGVALFLAISLLALFSLLGASYMRYMSLELEETDITIRMSRARHYAAAGIQSVSGHIHAALLKNERPAASHVFSYALYTGGGDAGHPPVLSTHAAHAEVSLAPLDAAQWEALFPRIAAYPGDGMAYHLVSVAAIQRAVPGGMQTLARHAIEAVVVFHPDGCVVHSWRDWTESGEAENLDVEAEESLEPSQDDGSI